MPIRQTPQIALSTQVINEVSYWDSLIITCALSVGATTLYSEDMHEGLVINQQLKIINP